MVETIKEKDLKKEKEKILKEFERFTKEILEKINLGEDPKIKVPIRRLDNIVFDEKTGKIYMGKRVAVRNFLDLKKVRKFAQTLMILATAVNLLREHASASLRDVYYMVVATIDELGIKTFEDQSESNDIIEDLEVIFNYLREEFNIRAKEKGRLIGPIKWVEKWQTEEGEIREVERDGTIQGIGGAGIPPIVEPENFEITDVKADFVLVVEKAAVFTRFAEDEFWKKYNCIIITGEGQAPRAVRRLLHRLRYEFDLPIYVLTDADPWGYYIYSVIKRGSINLSYLSDRLATPDAKFIGVLTQDIERYKLSKDVTMRLRDVDKKRVKELMEYPWFKHKKWQEEFRYMLKNNVKIEIEAMSSKGIRFLTKVYVPEKIENKDFMP